jgi:hypothetical protein
VAVSLKGLRFMQRDEFPANTILANSLDSENTYIGRGTILRRLLLSKGQGVRGVLYAPIGARLAVAAS